MKNNNLFKTIFLIVNLFSATTATNNSSLPLSGTKLTGGQNVSELVKRDEPITLYGGTAVQGIWINSKGYTLQRPCTLSFPIREYYGKKVFLTSYACSNTEFFVKDDNGELIPVGTIMFPRKLEPSRGLDYALVAVYGGYWSDLISKNVAFTEYLVKSNTTRFDLLAMTSSTQPPFTDLIVCVFGGLNGGLNEEMACGKILEFNVTVKVPTPGTDGEEWSKLVNVFKVNMTNDYDLGYMGAPVYIPGQIPFDTQIIAAPVGQVMETLQQYRGDESQDKKIWYYIPIDRILQDSGAELLLGDFSGNEQNSNSSSSKLQKRQGVILYGGTVINIRGEARNLVRVCTLGFAVRRTRGRGAFNQGYLTAGSCDYGRRTTGQTNAFVLENGNEVVVGSGAATRGSYNPDQGLDYGVIKARPNYWHPQGSMGILVNNVVVPVIGSVSPPHGFQVCL